MNKPTFSIKMPLLTPDVVPSISIRTSICLYLSAITLTLFCVLFLDRGIASWMHQYSHASYIFKPLSQMPLLFEILSALVLICCITPKGREKFASLALTLTITLIMASAVRVSAKFAFGRTWPETWVHTATGSNPSWITDGVEGFHPFAQGLAYNSFPSGHALFTFALVSVFWWRFPRLKGIWMIAMLGAIAGQVGQNYHFLGDLLAGATFGVLAAHISINISRYLSHKYQAG